MGSAARDRMVNQLRFGSRDLHRLDPWPLAVVPPEEVIRVGPGGYREDAGILRRLLASSDGWILVRPDAHVAWARHDQDGIEAAITGALGKSQC